MRALLLCPTTLLFVLSLSSLASAQPGAESSRTNSSAVDDTPAPTRRSGVVLGGTFSGLLGHAWGYRNELRYLDKPEYRASSGFDAGWHTNVMLGGALRDWFTFGLGLDGGRYWGNDLHGWDLAFDIRVEGFPAWNRGGRWRDLALFADFGAGSAGLRNSSGRLVADGGNMAFVGFGVAHETWRLGHFAFGPSVEYQTRFSPSMTSHQVLGGLRALYYGGP